MSISSKKHKKKKLIKNKLSKNHKEEFSVFAIVKILNFARISKFEKKKKNFVTES